MLILGLNSAHDAGVALVDDGRIVGLIQRERVCRVKRAALLTADFLEECLRDFGVAWADLDAVAMCTSQSWPIMFVDRRAFSVNLEIENPLPGRPEYTEKSSLINVRRFVDENKRRFPDFLSPEYFRWYFRPEAPSREYFLEKPEEILRDRSDYLNLPEYPDFLRGWLEPALGDRLSAGLAGLRSLRMSNYLPARFTLRGKDRPGVVMPHHLAHAAGAFYQSDCADALIHTLDNGDVFTNHRGYVGEMLMLGIGNRLHPLGPSFGYHGHFYQRVSERLKLGHGGGAGKLMGLAPYGEARYFEHSMVGDAFQVFGAGYSMGQKQSRDAVLEPLLENRRRIEGLSMGRFAESSPYFRSGAFGAEDLHRPGIDMAASAQELFERCTLRIVSKAVESVHEHAGMAELPLCLGGGGALNCPANSLVWRTLAVSDVFVPPACDDSGLPIGAALALCHDYLDRPRVPQYAKLCASAYLGRSFDDRRVGRAVEAGGDRLIVDEPGDTAAHAALAIARGEIVAWYEGRSEAGPRALGHRSILADPRSAETWGRVNGIKRREYWRPFAPAVLVEDNDDWFSGAPSVSPHMLFTATVRGAELPAITHVDGSARVQTVDDTAGRFRHVVEAFKEATGVPVVLNTSMNGPGEPIVDTPEEAVAFIVGSEADALYIGPYRVRRRA